MLTVKHNKQKLASKGIHVVSDDIMMRGYSHEKIYIFLIQPF